MLRVATWSLLEKRTSPTNEPTQSASEASRLRDQIFRVAVWPSGETRTSSAQEAAPTLSSLLVSQFPQDQRYRTSHPTLMAKQTPSTNQDQRCVRDLDYFVHPTGLTLLRAVPMATMRRHPRILPTLILNPELYPTLRLLHMWRAGM